MGASGSRSARGMDADSSAFPFGDLPQELLIHILTFVPAKDLIVNLRRVSKAWKELIDTKSLWIDKCQRDKVPLPPVILYNESVPIDNFKRICLRRPFDRNLLRNWNAKGKYETWTSLIMGVQCSRTLPPSLPPSVICEQNSLFLNLDLISCKG